MYCKYCGSQIQDQSRFCHYCGRELKRLKQGTDIQAPNLLENELDEVEVPINAHKERAPKRNYGSYSGRYERNTQQEAQQKPRITGKKILYFLYGLFLLGALFYSSNPDNNILNIEDMRKAYKYATEVLEEEVLNTDHEFPKFEPKFVDQQSRKIVYKGDDYRVYTVSAYVYKENLFGTRMKTRYVVEIGFPTNENVDGIYYNIVSYGNY